MPSTTLDVKTDLHGSTRKLEDMDDALEGMQQQAKKGGDSIEDMGEKFENAGQKMVIAGAVIIAGLALLVKGASDAEETTAKFGTVFQDVFEEASAAAKNLADNYGLSQTAAEEMLGATGDLLTGLGLTGETALTLSERTQQLAVDLASFTNFSGGAKGASDALTKAMLGEREMVKSLGIVITEEMIKEKLLKEGKDKLRGMTLLQAKAEATLQIAISQSTNAIGDYQRTQDGLANSTRELAGDFEDLRNAIGEKLIPVSKDLVNAAKDVVGSILVWTDAHPDLTRQIILLAAKIGVFLTIVGTALIIIPKLIAGFKALKLIATKLPIALGPIGIILTAIVTAMELGKLVSAQLTTRYEENNAAMLALREEAEKLESLMSERLKDAYDLINEANEDLTEKQGEVNHVYGATLVTMEELTEKYGKNKEKIHELIASGIVIVKTQEAIQAITESLAEKTALLSANVFDTDGKVKSLTSSFEAQKTPAELLNQAITDVKNSFAEFPIKLEGIPATIEGILDSVDFEGWAENAIESSEGMSVALTEQEIKAIEAIEAQAEKQAAIIEGFASDVSRAFGDMFVDIIEGGVTFEEVLGTLWNSIKSAFFQMISEMIAKWIGTFIAKLITSIGPAKTAMDGLTASAGAMSGAIEGTGTAMTGTVAAGIGFVTTLGAIAVGFILLGGILNFFFNDLENLNLHWEAQREAMMEQRQLWIDYGLSIREANDRIREHNSLIGDVGDQPEFGNRGGDRGFGGARPGTGRPGGVFNPPIVVEDETGGVSSSIPPTQITIQLDGTTLAEVLVPPLNEQSRLGNLNVEQQNLNRSET